MKKHLFLFLLVGFISISQLEAQTIIKVTVQQPEQLSVNTGSDIIISSGESVLIGDQVIVLGGTPDYSYSWTPIDGLNDPSMLNPFANPADTTTYYLTVVDAQGCTVTDSIVINVGVATNIDMLKDAEIKVYPNPSPKGIFTLSYLGRGKPMSISISSFDGKIILQRREIYHNSETLIDLSESPGVNIIRFEIDGHVFTKIVINSSSR